MTTIRAAPVIVLLAVAAAVPVYKWVDDDGRVHYSDRRPPGDGSAEPLELLPAPSDAEVQSARERVAALESRARAALDERAAALERQRREEQLAEAERADRLRRCDFARRTLATLQIRRPVYRIDASGERVYLDDASRAAEVERTQRDIATSCG